MTKRGAITSIVLWSCVAVVLLGVMILGIQTDFNYSSMFRIGSLHNVYSGIKDADEISSVEIGWYTGNVSITPSEDDQMRLTQTSRYDVSELQCTLSNGCLTIKQNNDWGFFFFSIGPKPSDLEISLPRKQYEEFTMNMTSGDTSIQNVSAKTIQLHTTSGKMETAGLKADTLTATVTSGKVVADSAVADCLSVKVTSGEADFDGSFSAITGNTTSGSAFILSDTVPQTLSSTVTSGKVSITIPDSDGFILNFNKTSGSFKTDFDLMTSINGNSGSYSYLSGGSAGRQYSAKITSGTFELLKAK